MALCFLWLAPGTVESRAVGWSIMDLCMRSKKKKTRCHRSPLCRLHHDVSDQEFSDRPFNTCFPSDRPLTVEAWNFHCSRRSLCSTAVRSKVGRCGKVSSDVSVLRNVGTNARSMVTIRQQPLLERRHLGALGLLAMRQEA